MINNTSPRSVAHLKYQTLVCAYENIIFEVMNGTSTDTYRRTVTQWCQMRRHSTRDTTIFYVSYYAGLRAKEIEFVMFTMNRAMCVSSLYWMQFKPKVPSHVQYG
jgi:hypothetical protein